MPGAPQMPQGMPGMPQLVSRTRIPRSGRRVFGCPRRSSARSARQQLDKSWDACPFCAHFAGASSSGSRGAAEDEDASARHRSVGRWRRTAARLAHPAPRSAQGRALHAAAEHDHRQRAGVHDRHARQVHVGQARRDQSRERHWILRDSGSTNGTYVNNRRVDRHELVDNDFIKFGSAMCKFKAL